ncbi:MAG: hypothetical protein AAF357_20060, partial [Verrucomicrobiota bacterium]
MTKVVMALAMAALIGAAFVAGKNMMTLTSEQDQLASLTAQYNRLVSEYEAAEQELEQKKTELVAAEQINQQVKADKLNTEDDLRRKNNEVERLAAQMDSRKAQLEELALVKAKLGNKSAEMLTAEVERLQGTRTGLEDELRTLENDVVKTQNEVEKAQVRIDDLVVKEEERKEAVALSELSGDLIAINREMGFVIINVGSDQGVKSDSPLLVMRGVDRIGRLRIVSVEPQVTVADIMPGSV